MRAKIYGPNQFGCSSRHRVATGGHSYRALIKMLSIYSKLYIVCGFVSCAYVCRRTCCNPPQKSLTLATQSLCEIASIKFSLFFIVVFTARAHTSYLSSFIKMVIFIIILLRCGRQTKFLFHPFRFHSEIQ